MQKNNNMSPPPKFDLEIHTKQKISSLMCKELIFAHPNMLLSEIDSIFEQHNFHHLPVLDENKKCIGIISKSDIFQMKDKFTKFNTIQSQKENDRFFKTILASEIMTRDVISLHKNSDMSSAIDIFLENKVHSIVVTDQNKCIGIITPIDILKLVKLTEYA